MSLYYDSSRYFPTTGVIIGATGKGPAIVPTVGSYKYQGCCRFHVPAVDMDITDQIKTPIVLRRDPYRERVGPPPTKHWKIALHFARLTSTSAPSILQR
jgi:hypothetical protein